MSRSRLYCRVAALALALGLLCLPAAYAAPASRGTQGADPAGIQQLQQAVWSFFGPIADILRVFQMDNSSPGQGNGPPQENPQEGVGIDPFGKPGPPGPP